jgi:hypothetical protein
MRRIERNETSLPERYSDAPGLRAAVQLIPVIGGALDSLFAGAGARLYQRRVERYFEDLGVRLRACERAIAPVQDEEGLHGFMSSVVTDVARARSENKRRRFVSLVASQLVAPVPWDDADAAERLLAGLDDIHVLVLMEALRAPEGTGVWEGCHVVCLAAPDGRRESDAHIPTHLPDKLFSFSIPALRMACAELVGKALLHDEGPGRMSAPAMRYFIVTDLAKWLMSRLTVTDESIGGSG